MKVLQSLSIKRKKEPLHALAEKVDRVSPRNSNKNKHDPTTKGIWILDLEGVT
jgi:hypothetical protein